MPSATISLTSKSRMHTAHAEADFVAAIESIKPTTIIGVSTIGGAFTQKVIEAMSRINERPVILALSNPTEHAECTPEQPILAADARPGARSSASTHRGQDGQAHALRTPDQQ